MIILKYINSFLNLMLNKIFFYRSKCNVCGSRAGQKVFTDVKGHYGTYVIALCNSCSVLYLCGNHSKMKKYIIENSDVRKMVTGYMKREGIFYDEADLFMAYNKHREVQFHAYKNIILKEKQSGRILDIGCGNGYFLSLFDSNRWDRTGIEYNESNYKECLRQNLRVYKSNFSNVSLPGLYDVIVMFEYIEHSVSPTEDINRCFELLRPGGLLLIETGNVNSSHARAMGAQWAYFEAAPDHKTFFSDATLSSLVRSSGFSDVSFYGTKEAEVMLLIAMK